MRLLSLFAIVSAVSLAKEPDAIKLLKKSAEDHPITAVVDVEALYTQPGVVEISGPVSVPLYSGDEMDPHSFVEVTLESGEKHLFAIDPFSAGVAVTEDFAKGVGAKIKDVHSRGAKHEVYKVAKIPGFTVGSLSFGEMSVWTNYISYSADVAVSGHIGLQTFPELAAALLLSQGELRLAPAADAASLLSAVQNGAVLSYSSIEPELIKDGRDMKWVNGRRPINIDGKLGDKDVLVTLSSWGHDYSSPTGDSVATRDVLAGQKPGRRFGFQGHYTSELNLGALPPFTVDLVEGPNSELTRWHWQVMLEAPVTGRWDVAYDPVGKTIAVAEAPTIVRKSWYSEMVAVAEKGFDPDPETGEPPKPKDQAGVWSTLSSHHSVFGEHEAALSAASKALENDPDSCASHMVVGEVLLDEFGRYAEAAAHLNNAAQMYDAWMEYKLPERQQFQEDKAKVEKDDGVWSGPIPQPHSCATAWSRVAHAELAQGHIDQVLAIYKDHSDLDYRLPLIAGNALAAQGRLKEAEAAYRQSLRLAGASSPAPNLALAIVQAKAGRIDDATENFMDAMFTNSAGLSAARAYGAAIATQRGAVAAEAALAQLARANPTMPHLALAHAELLVANGKDAAAPIAAAISGFERELRLYSGSQLHAGYAAALRLAGRAADAEAAAKTALKINPSQGLAMLVMADLAADAGDAAKAADWRTRAAQADADVPTMAPLFAAR